ncbi:MAG: hypothetical protein ACOCW8_01895 [bacterium]
MADTVKNEEKNIKRENESRGIVIFMVHCAAFFIIPVLLLMLIFSILFTRSEYYTGILKNTDIISTFIEVKNIETNMAIQEEIEREVGLNEYTAKFKQISENYKYWQDEFNNINKTDEYKSLVEQKNELKSMEWEEAQEIFPTRKQFEMNREGELARVTSLIENIKTYRDTNEDNIEKYEDKLEEAEDNYEDALDVLEDKQEEARDIAQKHRNNLSGRLYADLEILNPVLTKLLNVKLIDHAVRIEIEKLIQFFTTYEKQKIYGNVYSIIRSDTAIGNAQMLRVRFPEITINLWIKNDNTGITPSRHLLSDIFVNEIRNMNNLQNRGLFITMFKFSNTGLGEFFGRRILRKTGIKINDGLIYLDNLVLEDDAAETVTLIMKIATYSKYLLYIIPAIILLYISILFFSSASRKKKIAGIKSILIYPSLLIIIISSAAILASRFVFNHYPQLITDITMQTYAKSLLFVISLHTFIPVIGVFGILLLAGLIIKKINHQG